MLITFIKINRSTVQLKNELTPHKKLFKAFKNIVI